MYDVITSAIKNKSKRAIPQTSDPLKVNIFHNFFI